MHTAGTSRRLLRDRGIEAAIPEKAAPVVNRKRRGSKGDRPPGFDTVTNKDRNVIDRSFDAFKH